VPANRWVLRTYDRLVSPPSTPQPHNPLKRESDMFRVLIMFAIAAAIVIAVALLFGSLAGLIVGVILVAIGLWRTWNLIQDWRRYGSDPAER
jgi:Flp pilus assembly protein TadB